MEQIQNNKTDNTQTETKNKKKAKKISTITVKANKKGQHKMRFLNFLRIFLLPICKCIKPFRFYGNHKVKDGPYVYIINHYSLYDPIYPAATTWEGIHFVAKSEIFNKPGLSWFLRTVKAIPANRDGNDARVMMNCLKCLKNGEKVAVCPEGTRNKTQEDFLPFHPGAAAMAIKAKVPVIPMVIYKKARVFKMAHILIGDPIELSEYYDKKLTADDLMEAVEKLRQRMILMRNEHRVFLENKKKGKKA